MQEARRWRLEGATTWLRALGVVMAVITAAAVVESFLYSTYRSRSLPAANTQRLTDWTLTSDDGQSTDVSLPTDITSFAPGTHVTLSTTVAIPEGSFLYLSSRYDRYVVRLDGREVASYGQEGSFPPYMLDPPPSTSTLNLGLAEGGTHTLTIEYWAPQRYRSLLLKVPELGSFDCLRVEMFSTMGFSLFFSLALVAFGVIIILASLLIREEEKLHRAVFWLGTLCTLMGMWCLGECDLSCVILPRPLFLHLVTYAGLYNLLIPISELTPLVLGEDTVYTDISRIVTRVFAAVAILAQLTGLWQFSQTLPAFYVVAVITFTFTVLFSYITIYRQVGHATPMQEAYLAGSTLLSVFMLLELLDYNFWHTVTEMTFAELGMGSFVIILDLLSVQMIRATLELRQERDLLAARYDMAVHALDSSREQYRSMIASERELRRQRHDFKHQIATIRGYSEAGDADRLRSFLDTIEQAVPSGSAHVCDNTGVNSVALYYTGRGASEGVECDVLLDIPEEVSDDLTSDLCVVVGNLLENAVAANSGDQLTPEAQAAPGGGAPRRWVRMRGTHRGNTLFITQENSCWKASRDAAGNFVSTKGHTGIGLSSLQTVARRYGGSASFELHDGTFVSKVSLEMPVESSVGQREVTA